jgi:alanine dehydrogenase
VPGRVGWVPSDAMPELAVLDHDAVLAAVSATAAIDATREAFLRHHSGDWIMPPKVYLDSAPYGDFRAMPARGDDLALLKWVTSFPRNPEHGLPTVSGIVCLSDRRTGIPLALLDGSAVTALRTGAVAAVAAVALAPPQARTVGVVGCGLNGSWAARCMAAAGYGPGICYDPRAQAAQRLADELGWVVGPLEQALDCDVVCTITPGAQVVVEERDLRPGRHLNMLGADGSGKAEASIAAVLRCELFCDEWEQASHGGELAAAVAAGAVTREHVTPLGAVLAGDAPGRGSAEAITLFDSTGLAIQDLAVAAAALRAAQAGRVQAGSVVL